MEYRQLFSIENNKILGYKDSKFKRIIEVTIPNSVTEISEFMFANCKNLKKVILPKTLKNINSYAFKNCENLITIIFPEKLIFIGDYAFWNCFNLKKVRIPESIREISSVAFYQCKLSDFSIETSLFYFEPNDFNLLFSNRHISKLTIYNHEFDYAKKYFNFETFMKYIRNIRREELKDKIDGVLLENGITDKSCFKYSEHKIFINEIVKKLEIVQHYKYDEDFNKYMEEYIARNKQELVQMNDIDIILDKIINTKINEFDMSDSTSMEKFAMELNPYPMLITSLFQIIVSFHTNDLEQIKMKKVLDNINNTNNLSNFITKMFLNTNEGDVTVNKSSIEKLKSYSNYKINRTNDENEYLEKLKK